EPLIHRDQDLEEAFVAGQEQFLQSSIRQSIDTLDSIQVQVDENVLRSDVTEVEKEVTEEVVKLLRATSDFIHQGREIQFQLNSATKGFIDKRRSNGRLPFVVRLIRGLDTILDLTRTLATTTPQACDDIELNVLLQYPEQIASAAETITRGCREYIDSEKNDFCTELRGEVLDEQDYLEKKARDVESAGSELKSTLKRFMFLSPRSFEDRTRDGTPSWSKARGLLTDEEKIEMRQRLNQESPI
ncbi:hypothetical protein QZH41_011861, partial [Actinostola sp. cb2023]